MRPTAKGSRGLLALCVLAATVTGFSLARLGGAGPASSSHLVEIRQLEFHPAKLTVAVGDTIRWINRDIVPHTASAVDGGWGTGGLGQDEAGYWIARGAGEQRYYCRYHPSMRGKIIVTTR